MSFNIYLCCCQSVLLQEIKDKFFKQKDVALTYAMSMVSERGNNEEIDWREVNQAIIERWSQSGLNRVKKMAWKHVEQRFSGV